MLNCHPPLQSPLIVNPDGLADVIEGLAVLRDDQLALIFIRYIVDVYHNAPHEGLFGETPADALRRMEATVGLPPRLSERVQRRALGLRFSRHLTRRGIRFLAIYYNSPELQTLRHNFGSAEVACYLNPHNLNAISVCTGSAWIEVDTSIEAFSGVTLSEWIMATKLLRKKYQAQAELKSHIVADAMNYMRSTSQEALNLMRLLPQHPTAEDLERLEANLYWGLSVIEEDQANIDDLTKASDGVGYSIESSFTPSKEEAYVFTFTVLVVLTGTSLFIGARDVSLTALLHDEQTLHLLMISRLPRTLAALLTGASMAVAGVIMQLLVRNRFVEPGTTGPNESAMLGLLVVTLFAPGLPLFAQMLVASLAALAGTFGFLHLSRHLLPQQPLLVPLVGLIYAGVLYACATLIAYQTDLIQYIGIWMAGEFSGVLAGRYELLWLAGTLSFLAYFAADQFTLLGLGRGMSLSLGLRYGQVVGLGVATVSMVSALVIVTVGTLPFVGLVVPNVVSRIMGDNLRQSLPVVAGLGAGLVLACDILGRVVRHPYEIPAGTIFGILGAGLFLWMLLGRRYHG